MSEMCQSLNASLSSGIEMGRWDVRRRIDEREPPQRLSFQSGRCDLFESALGIGKTLICHSKTSLRRVAMCFIEYTLCLRKLRSTIMPHPDVSGREVYSKYNSP